MLEIVVHEISLEDTALPGLQEGGYDSDSWSAAELFGFEFRGGSGSHRVFVRVGVREILNFQEVKGKAKPYQVRQFIRIIENYNLVGE